jgi:excisionase family DNA binding protein
MPSYLTPEQTAQSLNVDVAEIMALIEQGKLRAMRIGDKIRIPEPEIETLLLTSAAGPAHMDSPARANSLDASRLVATRSGRAKFRVAGAIPAGLEIWPGKMRYPIKFPRPFLAALLMQFNGKTVPVGGRFDGPPQGSLGEFIQQGLGTKMNPAVYLAAILIEEGYADAPKRGYIRIHPRTAEHQQNASQHPAAKNLVEICAMVRGRTEGIDFSRNPSTGRPVHLS